MRCVVKLLLEIDALDDPAARKSFRVLAQNIVDAVGEDASIRALKLTEDGAGRLIDRWEVAGESAE